MRRYKGQCDIFFGIEHRLRKEEMEEQFNGDVKEGWRCAADAATLMRKQVVRIVNTRQEEFWWQSTATWEQLSFLGVQPSECQDY